MERLQLIESLKELSQLVKQRNDYHSSISRLTDKRNEICEQKDKAVFSSEPVEAEANILKNAKVQASNFIDRIVISIWVIAIATIILTGIYAVKRFSSIDFSGLTIESPIFLFLPLVSAGISVFSFYLIKNADFGCLGLGISWIFGLGSALETVVFAYLIALPNPSTLCFYLCTAISLIVAILVTFHEGWRTQLINKRETAIKSSKEYRSAVEKDKATERRNEQNRRNAAAEKKQWVQSKLAEIDSELRKLTRLYEEVDNKLKANTIFPYKDLDIIDLVIEKLEGMRANTLQEALLQVDSDERKKLEDLREQWRRKEMARDRQMQLERDQQREWEQQRHNRAMEKANEKRAEEAEKIRKMLEEN